MRFQVTNWLAAASFRNQIPIEKITHATQLFVARQGLFAKCQGLFAKWSLF